MFPLTQKNYNQDGRFVNWNKFAASHIQGVFSLDDQWFETLAFVHYNSILKN